MTRCCLQRPANRECARNYTENDSQCMNVTITTSRERREKNATTLTYIAGIWRVVQPLHWHISKCSFKVVHSGSRNLSISITKLNPNLCAIDLYCAAIAHAHSLRACSQTSRAKVKIPTTTHVYTPTERPADRAKAGGGYGHG